MKEPWKEKRILVIDDEVDFLDTVKRGLTIAGYRNVVVLNQPTRVKELLAQECFDVALIDVCMPQMSGTEVLQYIRSVCPQTRCLMITAISDAETAKKCVSLGARDYLIKPVSRERLLSALERTLRSRV